MSSSLKVAVAGATGNLGPAVVKALLDADIEVTILSRSSNSKTTPQPKQTVKVVDYTSRSSLVAALKGIDVVVSNLGLAGSEEAQKTLIDASVEAGVQRFLPSEYGNDLTNARNRAFPVFHGKVDVQNYAKKQAAEHPNFSYTIVTCGPFFSWGIEFGFLANPKTHTATVYDGGDVPFSVSELSTVGEAIVGIVKNLEITKNQAVLIHDGVFTQNKIIEIFKQVDGKEWKIEHKNTTEVEKWAYDELAKPDGPDKQAVQALYGHVLVGVFKEGHNGDFTGQVWNDKLGVKERSQAELEAIVAGIARKLSA